MKTEPRARDHGLNDRYLGMYQVQIARRHGGAVTYCIVGTFNDYQRAWDCLMAWAQFFPESNRDVFPVLFEPN